MRESLPILPPHSLVILLFRGPYSSVQDTVCIRSHGSANDALISDNIACVSPQCLSAAPFATTAPHPPAVVLFDNHAPRRHLYGLQYRFCKIFLCFNGDCSSSELLELQVQVLELEVVNVFLSVCLEVKSVFLSASDEGGCMSRAGLFQDFTADLPLVACRLSIPKS